MELSVNLIRHKRTPPFRRRLMFFGMIFYIIICVLFLVALCYKINDEIIKMNSYYRKALASRLDNSGFNRAEIKTKLTRYISILETIDTVLSGRVNLAVLLSKFYTALPPGAYLDNFRLDSDKRDLNFEVIVPMASGENSFNAGDLIFAWKQDASLMSMIDSINSSAGNRRGEGWVSEFSCSFSKKADR
ncbi:MAG: hypothetical protein WC569_00010 [Candidatus Omnitrophota bacterium]